LIRQAIKGRTGSSGLSARWDIFDEALYRHARLLSEEDQREIVKWLERRISATQVLIEGVGKAPEFGFSSELLDDERWSL
jgi:hypothetical protein